MHYNSNGFIWGFELEENPYRFIFMCLNPETPTESFWGFQSGNPAKYAHMLYSLFKKHIYNIMHTHS